MDTVRPEVSSTQQKHWSRQFWPWFLILLPASGVVASLFTITLAVQNAPTITDRNIGRFAKQTPVAVSASEVTQEQTNSH